MSEKSKTATKSIVFSAIFVALGVIIARFLSITPTESVRFSFESIPIFLSGVLFGPIYGLMVGFCTDFIGCLFSPFGFNPLFCLPPILYGLFGGLFRPLLTRKISLLTLFLSLLPPILLGSILWQSFALNFVYGSGFWVLLGARSLQFSVILVLDIIIIRLLFGSRIFQQANLWPPKPKEA